MAFWPAIALRYAVLIDRCRQAFEACFRRVEALLGESQAFRQRR